MLKEYKVFKSPSKTAKENNLILAGSTSGSKRLFDFSLLDGMEIPEEEKEVVKEYALKYVSVAFCESMYGKSFNNFHTCDGIAVYEKQNVYSVKTGKRLYTIFCIGKIKHGSAKRKSVYDDFAAKTYKCTNENAISFQDIEL